MVVLLAGLFWSLLIGWLVWRAVRQFAAHQVASLAAGPGVAPAARFDVSIVVPARNEIDNIEACLASLSAQAGLDDARIIVVDDGSQDGTRHAVLRAAVRDRRIALIDAGQLPGGWLASRTRAGAAPKARPPNGYALSMPMCALRPSWSVPQSALPSAAASICCRSTRRNYWGAFGSG